MTRVMTCMRGYPGSGKSSEAALLVNTTGAIRVCRDDIRKMLFDSYFTGKREDEDQVTIVERGAVHGVLASGTPVVIDATHLNSAALVKWHALADVYGYQFVVHDVPTDPATCIARDAHRFAKGGRGVGESVIHAMAKRYPIESWETDL